ncbi:MAG: cytochrome c biogenesis protein CcdA [Bellilinea sp.]|jgi:cytochrome c-type biogenesis protein
MIGLDVTVGLAFLAGLVSFLSPCVFSLVPVYIGYLSGRSVASSRGVGVQTDTRQTFLHGLAFVLGFSAVFMTLGLTMSALSSLLYDMRIVLAKVGGVIVVVFGLHMTGILRLSFLEYDLRPQSRIQQQRSLLSSALLGVTFSAGWSPCIGPVLGMILTLAITSGSGNQGLYLLAFYSAGLAIPFLAAALGIGWVTTLIRKHGKVMFFIEKGTGVVMIVVGILLFFGVFNQLARFGPFIDFGL